MTEAAPVTVVRIVGLMRSGTNLLTWVLRHNFDAVQTATMLLGWKHGPLYREAAALSPDEFVDPRFRGEIHRFIAAHPREWARLVGSDAYRAAAAALRAQSYGVALAVRDPARWYASCVRVHQEAPGFLLHGVTPAEAARFWNDSHRAWIDYLGERSVIVNTDELRGDPAPWLDRMAAGLRVRRQPGIRLPAGYLDPRGTEEIYELLGEPVVPETEREFTPADRAPPGLQAEFAALLDPALLARLGLAGGGAR